MMPGVHHQLAQSNTTPAPREFSVWERLSELGCILDKRGPGLISNAEVLADNISGHSVSGESPKAERGSPQSVQELLDEIMPKLNLIFDRLEIALLRAHQGLGSAVHGPEVKDRRY
jgi:hypothetical protein